MEKKKLFIRIVLLISSIFIVNFLAGKFYWYSAIWYFDMIMHFFGGFWVGLAAIWFLFNKKSFYDPFHLLKIISMVLLVGVAWEIFEFVFYNYVAENSFDVLDTISDLFFDLVGGIMAILYYTKCILLNEKNIVQ